MARKILAVLMAAGLLLTGCTSNKQAIQERPQNTLKASSVSKETKTLLSALGVKSEYKIYDLKISDSKAKYIQISFMHFENGRKTDNSIFSTSIDKSGAYKLVFSRREINDKKVEWVTTFVIGEGFNTCTREFSFNKKYSISIFRTLDDEVLELNKPIILLGDIRGDNDLQDLLSEENLLKKGTESIAFSVKLMEKR